MVLPSRRNAHFHNVRVLGSSRGRHTHSKSELPVPMLGQVYVKWRFRSDPLQKYGHFRGSGAENGVPVEAKRSFSHLGPSWGYLGPSWGDLGPSWGYLGASWTILGHLGAILGPSWAIMGHLGAILGPSWGYRGAILDSLRPSWNQFVA